MKKNGAAIGEIIDKLNSLHAKVGALVLERLVWYFIIETSFHKSQNFI